MSMVCENRGSYDNVYFGRLDGIDAALYSINYSQTFNASYPSINVKGVEPKSPKMDVIKLLSIKNVIFNPPATVIFWKDGSKTVVKAQPEDEFDPEKGFAMAVVKRVFGNAGNYYNTVRKWTSTYSLKGGEGHNISDEKETRI